MANSELVHVAGHVVTKGLSRRQTLIGRGLGSIQRGAFGLSTTERDALYRSARRIYNILTDDGEVTFCGNQGDDAAELVRIHKVFLDLGEAGYGKAYWPLAVFYEGGKAIPGDARLAAKYSRLAFKWCFDQQLALDPEIWTDLGVQYMRGKRTPQMWFLDMEDEREKAVQEGRHPSCMEEDKADVESGDGVHDLPSALFWLRKAAELGYGPAMFRISVLYERGWGIPWDNNQALQLALVAAQYGCAAAQWWLADMHSMHESLISLYKCVHADTEIAHQWALKADSQGHPKARLMIAKLQQSKYAELKSREEPLGNIRVRPQKEFGCDGEAVELRRHLSAGRPVPPTQSVLAQSSGDFWREQRANGLTSSQVIDILDSLPPIGPVPSTGTPESRSPGRHQVASPPKSAASVEGPDRG